MVRQTANELAVDTTRLSFSSPTRARTLAALFCDLLDLHPLAFVSDYG
jgi:hypothetical protein